MHLGETEKNIGNAIKTLRTGLGLSRQELALKLGISHQQVAKYECGINRIAASRLNEIAKLFNVTLDQFFSPAACGTEQISNRSRELLEVSRNYFLIKSEKKREALRAIIKSMTEE